MLDSFPPNHFVGNEKSNDNDSILFQISQLGMSQWWHPERMSSCLVVKLDTREITHHNERMMLYFLSQFHKDLNTSVSKSTAINREQRLTHRSLSFACVFISYKLPFIPPSLSLPPFRSYLLSCQSLSLWFSTSVWHINRMAECFSELFNPHYFLTWKTAREHHRGSHLSAMIMPLHPHTTSRHRWAHQTGSKACWWEEIH